MADRHSQNDRLRQAERGDLRPQFNPQAPAGWRELPADLEALEAVLLDRFFELARPIADASVTPGPELRLQDAGRFFYLIETLQRLGYPQLDETLQIILDDFCRLEPRAYDELYLWSIVQLSRTDPRHVRTYWPLVIDLDLRYRSAPWQRAPGSRCFEQPYRLTDLVFYYFVLYSLHREGIQGTRRYASLGANLVLLAPDLTGEQRALVVRALEGLAQEDRRPVYGDALGLLTRSPRQPPAGR